MNHENNNSNSFITTDDVVKQKDIPCHLSTSSIMLKDNEQIKTKIYPFINELVDSFYTDDLNDLIEKSIESDFDKNTFLMFIMMYFGIHFKLSSENDLQKKCKIKTILSDIIRNPEKRKICIELFHSKFNDTFTDDVDRRQGMLQNKDEIKTIKKD